MDDDQFPVEGTKRAVEWVNTLASRNRQIQRGMQAQRLLNGYLPVIRVHAGINGGQAIEAMLKRVFLDTVHDKWYGKEEMHFKAYVDSIHSPDLYDRYREEQFQDFLDGYLVGRLPDGSRDWQNVNWDMAGRTIGEYLEIAGMGPDHPHFQQSVARAARHSARENQYLNDEEDLEEEVDDPWRDVMLNMRLRQQHVLRNFNPPRAQANDMDLDESV